MLILASICLADFRGFGDADSIVKTPSYTAQMDSVLKEALNKINLRPEDLGFEKKFGG
jgi:hypothetical protein